ncbi:MAG TPA: STAS domain-containing protein [Pseudonocardiaceae bacterium]|nr:STAS domain-containing protein [Pseudonocardiaceae bacterium]
MAAEYTPESPAGDFFSGAQSPKRRNGIELLRVAVLQHDQAVVVVHVAGEIDMLTGPALQSRLDTALATCPARLIVDLSQVSLMGATGLTVLIDAKTVATPQGTTVQLKGLSRAAARVLHAARLTHLFEILPAEEGPAVWLGPAGCRPVIVPGR